MCCFKEAVQTPLRCRPTNDNHFNEHNRAYNRDSSHNLSMHLHLRGKYDNNQHLALHKSKLPLSVSVRLRTPIQTSVRNNDLLFYTRFSTSIESYASVTRATAFATICLGHFWTVQLIQIQGYPVPKGTLVLCYFNPASSYFTVGVLITQYVIQLLNR